MMLNVERRQQFLSLMDESGWDTLLLYGNTSRKDFFRSLINFNFFGPHAVAALNRKGISIVVSHSWDHELLAGVVSRNVSPAFYRGFALSGSRFAPRPARREMLKNVA